MDTPSTLIEKALAGGAAPDEKSRFSLKVRTIRVPILFTNALLSVGAVTSAGVTALDSTAVLSVSRFAARSWKV